MPTLTECMESIRELVKQKGHEDNFSDDIIFKKGLFSVIELSESLDIIKKKGVRFLTLEDQSKVSEELIDVIFYILDIYGLLHRELEIEDPDTVFNLKLSRNLNRAFRYGRPNGDLKNEKK